jgi:hypothetical protein
MAGWLSAIVSASRCVVRASSALAFAPSHDVRADSSASLAGSGGTYAEGRYESRSAAARAPSMFRSAESATSRATNSSFLPAVVSIRDGCTFSI